MTPWDLIVWALAASVSAVIVGIGVGIATAMISAARTLTRP